MMRFLLLLGLLVMIAGCTTGHWVKEGATPEEIEQANADCESIDSMQPNPATLSDKIGMPTELSTATFEKCMRGKGYTWVKEETSDGQKNR